MDMSKAFDMVNHQAACGKRFTSSDLEAASCYQRVAVLGETSDTSPVSSGIPQGSILGPMLFLIYVNNLIDSVLTSHVAMFAKN